MQAPTGSIFTDGEELLAEAEPLAEPLPDAADDEPAEPLAAAELVDGAAALVVAEELVAVGRVLLDAASFEPLLEQAVSAATPQAAAARAVSRFTLWVVLM
ncbi:hypothetical protein HJ588_02545 [Flexivirga sp. ID2601S]|uniref:Uncharacterized protein n=1 Tax=Flexivirga aerilata TaxID=1656889 RepID=A0A849AMX2_9MICO|nr:hypothetical protein [Flexivirga aerilata]NNG38152.1 hypothetical protein [Flexivirga aerilata]